MDGGDTAVLGLYQVVDAKWSFVVSCDWQCRPLDEQTTSAEQPEQPRQSTVVAPPPQAMDENEAQIGWFVFFVCFVCFFFYLIRVWSNCIRQDALWLPARTSLFVGWLVSLVYHNSRNASVIRCLPVPPKCTTDLNIHHVRMEYIGVHLAGTGRRLITDAQYGVFQLLAQFSCFSREMEIGLLFA